MRCVEPCDDTITLSVWRSDMGGIDAVGSGNPAKSYSFAEIKKNPTYLTAVAKSGGGHITIEGKAYTVTPEVDGIGGRNTR